MTAGADKTRQEGGIITRVENETKWNKGDGEREFVRGVGMELYSFGTVQKKEFRRESFWVYENPDTI